MAGYKTFNASAQPLWVTIYNLPGKIQMDWGEVLPGSWRSWESGPYAWGSFYRVRGEWPMADKQFDESMDNILSGPNSPKPYVFVDGGDRGYWIRPCWRTVNTLDRPIWVSIYNEPGAGAIDSGEVPARSQRDWFAGHYTSDVLYRLRAESIPDGGTFDVEKTAAFSKGWGVATLAMTADGTHEWLIGDRNGVSGAAVHPPMDTRRGAQSVVQHSLRA